MDALNTCNICNSTFASSKGTSSHIKRVHKEQKDVRNVVKEKRSKISCNICSFETYFGNAKMEKHIENVHNWSKKTDNVCNICGKSFKQKGNLRLHINGVHEGKRNFPCSICNYRGFQNNNLEKHMKAVHEGLTFDCEMCEFRCKTKDSLKKHNNIKHLGIEREKYPCKQCSSTFLHEKNLQIHLRSVHLGIKSSFDCTLCDYKASQKVHLKEHNDNVHLKVKKFKCSYCEKGFYYKQHLHNHENSSHSLVKIKCDQCDFTTTTNYWLKKNIYNKHEEKTEEFSCNSCDYKGNTKRKLRRHVANSHTSYTARTLQCVQCDYNGRNLKQHMTNVHGERIHICDQCDYVAKSNHILGSHISIVHGEKKMSCEMCDYKAKHKSILKIHIENVHLNLKQKCSVCEKELRKTQIKNHFRIHSKEEKTHQCSECDMKFYLQRDVNTHFKRKHKTQGQKFECHTCTYKTNRPSRLKVHIGRMHIQDKSIS